MAYQVLTASAPAANIVNAINGNHEQEDFTGLPHFDGTEVNPSQVELYIDSPTPVDFTSAVTVLNQALSLYNTHLTYSNGGDGIPLYAHLVQDTADVVSVPPMDGGTLYNTMFNAVLTLYLAIRTSYVNHINNLMPDQTTAAYHTGIDSVNVLGATPVINNEADLAVDMNNLKAQFDLHIVDTTGVHGAADMTNGITAPNEVSGQLDTAITLVNQLKTKLNAHFALGGSVHTGDFGADTQNTITAATVAYPGGLFDLVNAIHDAYEAHRVSTTYHNVGDSTNVLNIHLYPVSTITGLISAAADEQTKLNAHFRFAPQYSRAVRLI
jgi:hypothetical protein